MSYEITLSIRENSPQEYNIEALAEAEHVSREAAALKILASAPASPLARALALIEARDAKSGEVTLRTAGSNDAATEIRQMRAARTP